MLLIAHRITLSYCEPSNQKDSVSQRILPLLEKILFYLVQLQIQQILIHTITIFAKSIICYVIIVTMCIVKNSHYQLCLCSLRNTLVELLSF